MANKVWRDAIGKLFHDDCFEEGESKDAYVAVKLDELENDDECDSCGGVFLSGLDPVEDDDDNGEEVP
jgi:hypothetical protein